MTGLDALTWPRHTSRLTLRRGRPEDAAVIFGYRSNPEVARWLTWIQTDPHQWEISWAGRMPTTVVVECDGTVIGDTRVVVDDAPASMEIADRAAGQEAELMWAFHPDWHGQGYATEAVAALIELSFGELGVRRLVAHCYGENLASWRLMERVGMRREACFVRSCLHRDGGWRDFLHYGLLAPGA